MAVLRVTSCDYQPIHDRCILSVDVFYPDDESREGRTYFVFAPPREITDQKQMMNFIELDILSQRDALPDWNGVSWKSTRV